MQRSGGGKFRFIFTRESWVLLMEFIRQVFRFQTGLNVTNGLRLAWLSTASESRLKQLSSSPSVSGAQFTNVFATVKLTYIACTADFMGKERPERPDYDGEMSVSGCLCMRLNGDEGRPVPKKTEGEVSGPGKLCHAAASS
jgi:hypothetical protein